MIDYILISKDLNYFSEICIGTIFVSGLLLCIFFGFLIEEFDFFNKKKWHSKLSWSLTLSIILFAAGFNFFMISYNLNKAKKLEKRYSLKAKTLKGNIETVENEIEFFAVKDKALYVNQILNKFYKNERNLNSVEKEIIGKLVK